MVLPPEARHRLHTPVVECDRRDQVGARLVRARHRRRPHDRPRRHHRRLRERPAGRARPAAAVVGAHQRHQRLRRAPGGAALGPASAPSGSWRPTPCPTDARRSTPRRVEGTYLHPFGRVTVVAGADGAHRAAARRRAPTSSRAGGSRRCRRPPTAAFVARPRRATPWRSRGSRRRAGATPARLGVDDPARAATVLRLQPPGDRARRSARVPERADPDRSCPGMDPWTLAGALGPVDDDHPAAAGGARRRVRPADVRPGREVAPADRWAAASPSTSSRASWPASRSARTERYQRTAEAMALLQGVLVRRARAPRGRVVDLRPPHRRPPAPARRRRCTSAARPSRPEVAAEHADVLPDVDRDGRVHRRARRRPSRAGPPRTAARCASGCAPT